MSQSREIQTLLVKIPAGTHQRLKAAAKRDGNRTMVSLVRAVLESWLAERQPQG
jgi:hypothetical protein